MGGSLRETDRRSATSPSGAPDIQAKSDPSAMPELEDASRAIGTVVRGKEDVIRLTMVRFLPRGPGLRAQGGTGGMVRDERPGAQVQHRAIQCTVGHRMDGWAQATLASRTLEWPSPPRGIDHFLGREPKGLA